MTREAWLNQAVELLRPLVAEVGMEVPEVHVSVGWPSRGGTASKGKVIGECWKTTVSTDGVGQIFISPILGGENDAEHLTLLGVLLHEMIHAGDDCESGHRGNFAKTARAIGLEGKMTATVVGEDLADRLRPMLVDLGPLPHAPLNPFEMAKQRKKQTTRMLKVECASGSGYIVRMTQKWMDELGLPICPCHQEEMETA